MQQITQTAGNSNQIVEALLKWMTIISHIKIFQIYPTNESRDLEMCHLAFEYMLQVCEAHEADAAARLNKISKYLD